MRKLLLFLFTFTVFSGTPSFAQGAGDKVPADSANVKIDFPMMNYSSPQRYIINDVNIHGIRFMDENSLIMLSGLKKGDEIYLPGDYISQTIKNFWNRRYFSDIEVVGEIISGDSVNFDIYFTERPMVYTWRFEGIGKGQAKTLTEDLALKAGNELSDFVINKNVNLVKKHFINKGFRNVEVDARIENDTVYKNAVIVTFVIDRKQKVKVGDIKFEGNEVFSDKRLRKTFKKTHKKNWNILKGAKFNEANFEDDKELLVDFYNSKGYRNANVVSDSMYVINDKRIGLVLNVEEGNKFFFRNISWVGNSVYPTEYLDARLGLRKGDTYDKKTMQKRLGIGTKYNDYEDPTTVSSLYQNEGYIFSEIDPTETIIGEDSIDLELKIFEGKPATVNEVSITGNMRINDEVIRRELTTRPGDLYNRALLMQTMRLLSQMQHFNPEAIAPDIQPVTNELINITWELEEQASDRAEISGGWGAGMFVGSVGLELNNLSLKNFFKKGAWRPYPQGQSQQLRIRAQSNGSYYKSFSISFTEPWLGGRKPNSLTVSTFYSDETNASYMWQKGSKHFRTIGAAVGIGRRLNWPDPYFTLYNEISYQAYNLKDWDYFIMKNGTSNIISFTTVFGRNSVDQPLYPRWGSDFSISVSLTPPYSLFDNKDYKDPNLPDNKRYHMIEYHKWKLKGQWFTTLTPNQKLVFMAKAEMGYIGSYNRNKVSPFEGFDVGGDGMSGYNLYGVDIIGLRGYENGALTPYSLGNNEYARVYNKYVAEFRYPIMLKPSSTIYALVFAEGGNAFSDWNKFNPFQIKRSVGAGLRIFLPIVGMLGIDYGYGFDKAVGSTKKSGSQVHYSIGMEF